MTASVTSCPFGLYTADPWWGQENSKKDSNQANVYEAPFYRLVFGNPPATVAFPPLLGR